MNTHHRPPSPPPAPGEPWSDALVEWYLDNYANHPTNQMAVTAAALSGSETVLDISCGGGAAVRAAALALSTGKVAGIDPAPAMVRIAEEAASSHAAADRMAFSLGSAEDLRVASDTVDVAMAANSLHHWADMRKGLSEVARVLRKSGRFIVVEEIFHEPGISLDSGTIQAALARAGLPVSEVTEQTYADGRALIFIARPEVDR